MRADTYLTVNGYCESRSRAAASINAGCLFVNGRCVTKCSFDISDTDTVELRGEAIPDVSRGGLKLRGAFEQFKLDCKDMICVDVGASTGGFTDVLLKNGAKRVYAVDCGIGQLHMSLVNDSRVVNIEGFNARELTEKSLGEKCDMAVMDVSFISQTLLHSAVSSVLRDGGIFVSLIKPQFESGKRAIGKGGIVKDSADHINAITAVVSSAEQNGLALAGIVPSPISGGDGNREYLALFVKNGERKIDLTREELKKLTQKK